MSSFNEVRFKERVEKSLGAARAVLQQEKNPQLSNDVPHTYNDKYILANVLTNTYLSASLNVLELLGLSVKGLRTIWGWVHKEQRSVTFRLKAEERCEFNREETREEDSKTKHVTEYTGVGGGLLGKRTDKTVTTIHEYFWDFSVEYSLIAYFGNSPDDCIVLQNRSAKLEVKTSGKANPRDKHIVRDSVDLNATWLFQQLKESSGQLALAIDRAAKSTYTPRRNADIDAAFRFCGEWNSWCSRVVSYFRNDLFSVHVGHGLDLESLNDKTVFVPVIPLMEKREMEEQIQAIEDGKGKEEHKEGAAGGQQGFTLRFKQGMDIVAAGEGDAAEVVEEHSLVSLGEGGGQERAESTVVDVGIVNAFLNEQKRTMSEKCSDLGQVFPDGGNVITSAEAIIVVACLHGTTLGTSFVDGMEHIESLIFKQVVAAIGKEVSTVDFANYMVFHGRKIYKKEYQPQPFCYAVRRPGHYPEGIVSIEAQKSDGSMAEPIHTLVSRSEPKGGMSFSIHAAAEVEFSGECYVHGWLDHVFGVESSATLTLNARARQFSSFLVLVGRVAGPDVFDPQFGMIVQNKDEIRIPLDMEMIPPPGEFRESIQSLSDEQQAFAKAYRGMQLASTLFAVCVIQIKPQLERLLKLPHDGLTKEIRLTQDLLEMFIKYQIPSDLVSFGGAASAPDATKVDEVKKHVKAMQEMIEHAKDTEIEKKEEKNLFRSLKDEEETEVRENVMKRVFKGAKKNRFKSRNSNANDNNAPVVVEDEHLELEVVDAEKETDGPVEGKDDGEDLVASSQFEAISGDVAGRDVTKIPKELDAKFEALDQERALRPTIINVGHSWEKKSQPGLLSKQKEEVLGVSEQKLEKNACYDLLDALTKSGCLAVEGASLHVMVAATHVFQESVMNTLCQKNVNPIEKVEQSSLMIASTIHESAPKDLLVNAAEAKRVEELAPRLFDK